MYYYLLFADEDTDACSGQAMAQSLTATEGEKHGRGSGLPGSCPTTPHHSLKNTEHYYLQGH